MLPEEVKSEPDGPRNAGRLSRLLLLVAILLVVAAVIVVVFVVVGRDDATTTATTGGVADGATQVTSPYDLHELPADTDPGEVKDASLVSVSLPNDTGGTDYYGLSADTDAAKALIQAVSGAEAVEAAQVEPTQSTLTFMFPDRSTLAYELYVQAGVIGRSGGYWRVDGDLAALVEAALAAGRP